MARSVSPFQAFAHHVTMTGAEDQSSSDLSREDTLVAKKSANSPKPLAGSLANCFATGCGEKSRQENVPNKKPQPPPSQVFFKNGVRALWADKHCPRSLSSFQCHSQQTQQLKQLISQGNCPPLIFEGPSGAGKKALATALLHDIFGDIKILYEYKPFSVQGGPQPTITVPIATSRHHVEVNLRHVEEFDKDVLQTIFKEISLSLERARDSPAVSQSHVDTFKLIMILQGEILSGEAQQSLRRLMDRYGDTCKLVLCCNLNHKTVTEPVISEGLRSRCQIINVEVPSQEEIVRVLNQIAKKEDINLPKAVAAKIADHCKTSLRKAIVQLETCKHYQYPFSLGQRVHIDHWEEDVIEIVADIMADPTSKRLFIVRAKMQTLLTDCVSPVLILQKLVEEFLLRTDSRRLKKHICHWASFYERRLPTVPNPIFQLEAYLAKVTSMYKIHITSKAAHNVESRPSLDHSLDIEMSPSQNMKSFLAMQPDASQSV